MSEHDDLAELRERIERISEDVARVRQLGEARDIPAVERNARRIEGTLRMLEHNVPPTDE